MESGGTLLGFGCSWRAVAVARSWRAGTGCRIPRPSLSINSLPQCTPSCTCSLWPQGEDVDWSIIQLDNPGPQIIYGQQSAGGGEEAAAASCCACCGVAARPPAVSLRRCSSCRQASYCGAACQTRDWRCWHKTVCQPAGS